MSILKQFDLHGQTALITGGNRGLGIEMAKALAEAGANIIILARDPQKNQEAVDLITESYGVRCIGICCDITQEDQVDRSIQQALSQFQKIEILINSAGINIRGAMEELSLADFQKVQEVNVTGSWLVSRALVPQMKEINYGRILHIGSMLSIIGMVNRTPYATSKGAVLQLTRAMALELAPFNIRVNAMLPGPFATEMNLSLTQDPEKFAAFVSQLPVGRWGELHEIGALALYLCSPAAGFVTGTGFTIDGGWSAR